MRNKPAGNLLLLGMIAALASSGVVSSQRCLEFSPDLGSIPLQRRLRLIISRGLWSVSMMNVLLYRYVWNFSQPYTMAKSSLSMLA